MPCFPNEPSCVKYLRELIKDRYPHNKVVTHRNIERKFLKEWREVFRREPPATQEIDLIRGYMSTAGEKTLEGVEVKYFKSQPSERKRRYTEGFGQALGLLTWGFDRVTLYHVFDVEFPEKQRRRFVRTAVELKNRLGLIDYRGFLATKEEGDIKIYQLHNNGARTNSPPTLKPGIQKNRFYLERDSIIISRRNFIESIFPPILR